VAVLRAALRDLQWRWKRFVIAMVGVALVFAMGLIMTGLSESFSLEVERTLDAIDADVWAVSEDASGPFTSFVPVPASAAGPAASPVMVLRQTVSDRGTLADIIVVGVEPGRLGSPRATDGVDLGGSGEAVVDDALEGAGLGDTFSMGGTAFRVVGTVTGQRLYAGLPVVYITLSDAQAIAVGGQPLATAFLFAGAPSSVPAGLRTMSNGDVKTDVLRPLRDAMSSIAFVRLLLWVVAATIIGSVLYLQAMERTRDFAVFKATGSSTVEIGVGLALQAVVLSLAAAVLAAALAVVLAPRFPMHVEIPTNAFLLLPVVTVAVGLLASLVALRRTATVQPALAFGG
jgi:putative ABC transport system permease protein